LVVGVLATLIYGLLAAFGGFEYAGTSPSAIAAYQYEYDRVTICHRQKETITISVSALAAHQGHGDTLGPCPPRP
jgi:hypothetical protein